MIVYQIKDWSLAQRSWSHRFLQRNFLGIKSWGRSNSFSNL